MTLAWCIHLLSSTKSNSSVKIEVDSVFLVCVDKWICTCWIIFLYYENNMAHLYSLWYFGSIERICFLQTYLVTWNAIYFRKSIAFVCNGETWTYLKIASHVICGRYWFRGRIIATGSKMRAFYVKQRLLCKFTHFSCSTTNQFETALCM